MNPIAKTLLALSVVAVMAGCASPTVIETKKITDENLTCAQIESEIAEADRFKREAKAERKVTGTNVAAAIFFWPALLGTYSNTQEAMEAADERKAYLTDMYVARKCSQAKAVTQSGKVTKTQ